MNDENQNSIYRIVENNVCVGCGFCAGMVPESLEMRPTRYGTYLPYTIKTGEPDASVRALAVCPFHDGNENEDQIAQRTIGRQEGAKYLDKLGYYLSCFIGYRNDEEKRIASTSGGIIHWCCETLLHEGVVDAVACVGPSGKDDPLFEYKLVTDLDELATCRKSRYYPIEASGILKEIKAFDGKVLFVGLPCFLKALNLAKAQDEELRKKIPFTIGLFCGHLKSKHFSAYLARNAGISERDLISVDFRKKLENFLANMYGAEFTYRKNGEIVKKTKPMHEMWIPGWTYNLFMLDACEWCDDMMSETADLSVGDAWLPEYKLDYRGTSVVVCRNAEIQSYIEKSMENGELHLETAPAARIVQSQAGGLRQRRDGLQYRLYLAQKHGWNKPRKRVRPDAKIGTIFFRLLQHLRIKTKEISRESFLQQLPVEGLDIIHDAMRPWVRIHDAVNFIRHSPELPKRIRTKLRKEINKRLKLGQ